MWDDGSMKTPPDSRYELQLAPYLLPDLSVGRATGPDPLESYSWAELREIIYESFATLR